MRMFFVLVGFLVWPVFGVVAEEELKPDDLGKKRPEVWNGKEEAWKVITKSDLEKILKWHDNWLESEGKEEKNANIEGVDLGWVNLKGVDLGWVNLKGADLEKVNFERVDLGGVNLKGANLFEANLEGANLFEANLEGANLEKANLEGVDLMGANLKGTNLCYTNLKKANLWFANLKWTNLQKANLEGAMLIKANLMGVNLKKINLKGANLQEANLEGANLQEANLEGANLREANLKGANLQKTNLKRANLQWANLKGANLQQANLEGVNLMNANFKKAIFDIEPRELPDLQSLSQVKNLHRLTYSESPGSLIKVRKKFKENVYRQQERELTYAIHHNRIQKESDFIEKYFCYIFFEFTCGWGMNFFRPIIIMFSLIFVFSYFYKKILLKEKKKDGIWKIWFEGRVRKDLGGKNPELLRLKKTSFEYRRFFGLKVKWIKNWDVIKLSLYFSLLSAFHIGWREFNVGSWITKIQPQEYALRATGTARVISGIQSLISVYLLALSILTYFGRPFD